MFESVFAVAFQNIFHAEMYQNDVFLLLKFIFNISVSKPSKHIKN